MAPYIMTQRDYAEAPQSKVENKEYTKIAGDK
jgi:hypothetical protein